MYFFFFFFNDTATTEIYTLSLHDALPISIGRSANGRAKRDLRPTSRVMAPSPVPATGSVALGRDLQYERARSLDPCVQPTRRMTTMNRRIRCGAGISTVVLAAAVLLLSPMPGFSQTQGVEHRQNRRQNRDDARATRQAGRHDARDAKQECKDASGNRIECRHQKREMKQDARGAARDLKFGTTGEANK